jgi:hypothetical protein
MMRSVLLPLLPTLSTFSGAFDSGLDGHDPSTAGNRPRVNQSEGSPETLLTRSVSGCDVKQLLVSFLLLAADLVNHRAA